MREIKFRAWNPDTSFMSQGSTLQETIISVNRSAKLMQERNGTVDDITVENYIYMQYTGRKAKDSKEIYEGDLIKGIMGAGAGFTRRKGKEAIFEVKVYQAWAGAEFTLSLRNEIKGDYRSYPRLEDCEVIGNIYENPELPQ